MTPTAASHDTGLLTLWFSCNYGAILTTYALYRLLEQEGRHPLVLDQSALTGSTRWSDEKNISRSFIRRNGLQCSAPLSSDTEIQRLNDELQTFVIGSDQVWRWRYTKAYGLLHFLDFVRCDKRKISVASSFGIDREERPADSVCKAGYYLRSFDAVSVREKSGLEILRNHYGVEGEWIPDPVFLCDIKSYDELLTDTLVPEKPYLLSYVLEPDDNIRHLIETIATERGLEVINMVDAQGDFEKLRTRFGNIGNIAQGVTPEQWVTYIRHCAYFVTDSFHGICFAHLYHRDFVCVAPPERGLTRFTSLLGLTKLERCLLPPNFTESDKKAATGPIDWESVQARLNTAIEGGRRWLHHALSKQRTPQTQARAEIAHELLYAGNGAKERYEEEEAMLQEELTAYRLRVLPKFILLKKIILRLFCYCPILRSHCYPRLQNLRRLAAHLKRVRV